MKRFLFVVLMAALPITLRAQPPLPPSNPDPSAARLTEGDIATAIRIGSAKNADQLIAACAAKVGFGGAFSTAIRPVDVTVAANAGQIAALAADAARLYQSFSRADVPESLMTPAIFVVATSRKPMAATNGLATAPHVDRIVLKAKQVVVQPATLTTDDVDWARRASNTSPGARVAATFPLAAVLTLPRGPFDVVIVTAEGERTCTVGEKDRARLFLPNGAK